jgi:hypothetical protein
VPPAFTGEWGDASTNCLTLTVDDSNQIHGTWNTTDPIRGDRPDFFGTVVLTSDLTGNSSEVTGRATFPDDGSYTFVLDRNAVNGPTITWSNCTTWVKTNSLQPNSEEEAQMLVCDDSLNELGTFLIGCFPENSALGQSSASATTHTSGERQESNGMPTSHTALPTTGRELTASACGGATKGLSARVLEGLAGMGLGGARGQWARAAGAPRVAVLAR